MGIQEKIEEIRRQPQHIRWRYTFASVFVCMFFVIGIWFMTLGQIFTSVPMEGVNETLDKAQKTLIDGKNQANALQESLSRVPEAFRQAASDEKNAQDPGDAQSTESEKSVQPFPIAEPKTRTGTGAMEDPSLVQP